MMIFHYERTAVETATEPRPHAAPTHHATPTQIKLPLRTLDDDVIGGKPARRACPPYYILLNNQTLGSSRSGYRVRRAMCI